MSSFDEQQAADDLAWATITPRKCRHPRSARWGTLCDTIRGGCGKELGEAVSRGRRSRQRGNAIERDVGKQLGLRRVGQFGGPNDLGAAGEPFIVQVKSGKSFPERIYRWLKALPANASQTPIVVVTDAPGPGHRRRALVVLTLEDWVALHGPAGTEEAA